MKTSTTILVIFLFVVFLTPFLVALALKSKLQAGDYKVVKQDVYQSSKKFKVGDFKVVKLTSSTNDFHCTVIKDDSSFISYPEWSNDSVSLSNSGDTLMVNYARRNVSGDIFNVQIHVTDPSTILGDKVSIAIFPGNYFADHPLSIYLRNEASVNFLSSAVEHIEENDEREEGGSGNRMRFNKLTIDADGSEVRLPAFLDVEALTFNLYNKSKLIVPGGFKYGQLSASVSDDSEVQAPWHVVKEFKTSAEKK
jgi:hypothetical protein